MSNGMRGWYRREWLLVRRSPLVIAALILLGILSALAVWSGMAEIARQRDSIGRLMELQGEDLSRVIRQNAKSGDPGYAAYYTFHGTWDPPSALAFAAIGQRDIAPYALRIRALGLQAQIHEGETFNPESALAGRFDYVFVLVYLAPLFAIALFHDFFSGEREAGRLQLLRSLASVESTLWRRRAFLRWLLLCMATALPFVVGAIVSGVTAALWLTVVGATALYLAFWSGLSLLIASLKGSSATHAARLLGVWMFIALVLPTLSHLAINRSVPAEKGVDLVLKHREAVHGAWEQPRELVMRRFSDSHPQWRDKADLLPGFEWKWYYAFHQLADERVARDAAQYRQALLDRQRWTVRIGALLPPVAMHVLMHRMADTDLPAQMAYQAQIAVFHEQLRAFYYPYLFDRLPFVEADYARAPEFVPRIHAATIEPLPMVSLAILSLLMLMRARHASR